MTNLIFSNHKSQITNYKSQKRRTTFDKCCRAQNFKAGYGWLNSPALNLNLHAVANFLSRRGDRKA